VTVIAPVFLDGGNMTPEFFVASRGHHADIGGITPGSMPPNSTHVDEEGVLLDNVALVAEGRFLEAEMRAVLAGGRYPSRNVEQNLADLRAQVAACAKGAEELAKMVAHFGIEVVRAYMQHVQDNAEESVRRVLDVLTDGSFEYEMDNGAKIAVRISIDKATQAAVLKAAADAETRGWKLSEEKNGWYLAQLKDKGMVIIVPSEQLTADLRKVGNYMLAEWLRKSGDDGRKVIDAYRGM